MVNADHSYSNLPMISHALLGLLYLAARYCCGSKCGWLLGFGLDANKESVDVVGVNVVGMTSSA